MISGLVSAWCALQEWITSAIPFRAQVTSNRFSTRLVSEGVRQFTAKGDLVKISQILIEMPRVFSGRLGLILVEYTPEPKEWVAPSLNRTAVLSALVGVRDLLGTGCVDTALHSYDQAIEVFVDRCGLLEIRTGQWHEPQIRGLLEAAGFEETERVSTIPERPPRLELSAETRLRVASLIQALELTPTEAPNDSEQSEA